MRHVCSVKLPMAKLRRKKTANQIIKQSQFTKNKFFGCLSTFGGGDAIDKQIAESQHHAGGHQLSQLCQDRFLKRIAGGGRCGTRIDRGHAVASRTACQFAVSRTIKVQQLLAKLVQALLHLLALQCVINFRVKQTSLQTKFCPSRKESTNSNPIK